MHRLLWAAVLIFLTLSPRTNACVCLGPSHEQSIRAANLILAVHVDGVEPDSLSRFQERYFVHVLAVWKGDVPETTTITAFNSGACGYPLEPGNDYLIYILRHADGKELESSACRGSGPLEGLYYDRYLLGEPAIRYSDNYRTVELETMLDRIKQPGAEDFAWQFSMFSIETPHLLPTLRRIARQDIPGNQLAAVRAIGMLGTSALDAYDDIADVYERWGRSDSKLRAAALYTILSLSRSYAKNRAFIMKGMSDPDPLVRVVAVMHLREMSDPDELEVRRLASRAFADADPRVRGAALRTFRVDYSAATARHMRRISRTDDDADIRSDAKRYLINREQYANSARPCRSVRARGFEYADPRLRYP